MQDRNELIKVLLELATMPTPTPGLVMRALELIGVEARLTQDGRHGTTDGATGSDELVVSIATCCVQWRGRRCVLGPSLSFALMHRLACHPGRYFPYDALMDEVWHSRRTDGAIRTLVKRLRCALRSADMDEVATAIQVRGRHVGFFLNGSAS